MAHLLSTSSRVLLDSGAVSSKELHMQLLSQTEKKKNNLTDYSDAKRLLHLTDLHMQSYLLSDVESAVFL